MKKNVNILVVDDEEVVLQSIKKILKPNKKYTYHLEMYTSVYECMKQLHKNRYDLIITDLNMPGIDGLKFLEQIRTLNSRTPVIMITAYASLKTAFESQDKGAFGYIAKPYTNTEFRTIVHRALDYQND